MTHLKDDERPIALYRRSSTALVALFPNWSACKSVMGDTGWHDLCWLYTDETLDFDEWDK
jgi:hypothetical protein